MAYRSERFAASDMPGLEQVWRAIDELEAVGLPVATEVMAGKSYRRQLNERTAAEVGDVNYVLQAVVQVPESNGGKRVTARHYVNESRRILNCLQLPGEPTLDEGGLKVLDPSTSKLAFGSTGSTEDDILEIYAPWISTQWTDASKQCMFFCGIEPPQPKRLMEEHPIIWGERLMRSGLIVFQATPQGLETY